MIQKKARDSREEIQLGDKKDLLGANEVQIVVLAFHLNVMSSVETPAVYLQQIPPPPKPIRESLERKKVKERKQQRDEDKTSDPAGWMDRWMKGQMGE